MHTLIFATNNRNKVAEIQSLIGPNFTLSKTLFNP